MTFARVNALGWALFEELTSAQMNQLDINMTTAVDGGAGGAYTPSAQIDAHPAIERHLCTIKQIKYNFWYC